MLIKNIFLTTFILFFLGCEQIEREEESKTDNYETPINNINDDTNKNSASEKLSEKSGQEIYENVCAGCHGTNGEKSALGKSDVIKYWEVESIVQALKEYKNGTRDLYGMGDLMMGQMQDLSDNEMRNVANYVYDLN